MIQPIDIKTQKFKKGLFGYKSSDVDSFVNTVYRAYEDLFKENAELSDNLEKINSSLQESRLKVFELESEIQKLENVSSYGEEENTAAKKKADEIIKNAEAAAAEIIAKAKAQSEKIDSQSKKEEPAEKSEEKVTFKMRSDADTEKASASSKFFKKAEEDTVSSSNNDDDDEIFVGEIEDARKPDRMMIGDGEEEEDLDFEFL